MKYEKTSQNKGLFDDKVQMLANFINQNYNIRIPVHDHTKISITCKDPNRYDYQPTENSIWLHCQSEGNMNVSESLLRKVISEPKYVNRYNPIAEYFDSIRGTYKGESHIDLLISHLLPRVWDIEKTSEMHNRRYKYIKKWLISCVAQWLHGKPNDVALGFIHRDERIGKTFLTEFIVPPMLKEYYRMASKDERKFDIEDAFTRFAVVNFDEMQGITSHNLETFKKLIRQKEVVVKRGYERIAMPRSRIACCMFTTNNNEERGGFMIDSGDSRWCCIELESIDREYSKRVDIDQLWAEALLLLEESDFEYAFTNEDTSEFARYNVRYKFRSKAMKYIGLYVSPAENEDEGEKLNATMILQRLVRDKRILREDLHRITYLDIGKAMHALGYQQISFRKSGIQHPIYGYHVKFNE